MTVAIAAVVILTAFVFILFIRPGDIPEPVPVSPLQHLEDRKQAIYSNLRDLQFEFRLGKLSDADYGSTKQALQKELAGVLLTMEEDAKRLGLTLRRTSARPTAPARRTCSACGATFDRDLKFCGECGKALA